jgi:glycine oxidase
MSETNGDVLIVGAGVIGLGIADTLARRGLSVTVLERERAGSRASWAGAGMLNLRPHRGPDAHAELIRRSIALHETWAARLKEETDIDVGFKRCGSFELYLNDVEPSPQQREPEELLAGCAAHDVPAQRLSPAELALIEPRLATGRVKAAIHLPADGQIRSPRLGKALAVSCRQWGVSLIERVNVADIVVEGGRIQGAIDSAGKRYVADTVIVCGGAWTGCLPTLRSVAPIVAKIAPVRGQIVCYQLPRPIISRIVTVGHRYLVPRPDGVLLVGSTTEHVGFDSVTTPEAQASLRDFAVGLLPELKGVELLMGWADFRPGMKGPHPFIGAVPGVAGLYIAAGHYRDGLCLAPVTAEIMADMVCPLELESRGRRCADIHG